MVLIRPLGPYPGQGVPELSFLEPGKKEYFFYERTSLVPSLKFLGTLTDLLSAVKVCRKCGCEWGGPAGNCFRRAHDLVAIHEPDSPPSKGRCSYSLKMKPRSILKRWSRNSFICFPKIVLRRKIYFISFPYLNASIFYRRSVWSWKGILDG